MSLFAKRIILGLIIIVLGICIYTYLLFNKEHVNIANTKPDVEMKAVQLFEGYETDEISANKKYLGKVILLEGRVGEINAEKGNYSLILKKEDDFFGVSCYFLDENIPSKEEINLGDDVRIKGICDGFLSDVVIRKCTIVYE